MPYYHNGGAKWPSVTRADPCPECGKADRCKRSPDGDDGYCFRDNRKWNRTAGHGVPNGHGTGYVGQAHRKPPATPAAPPAAPGPDWAAEAERLRGQLTPERLADLAAATGLPVAAWAGLSPGWATADDLRRLRAGGAGWAGDDYPTGAYAIVERSGNGRAVGLSLRAPDGRKGACGGAGRGLVFPPDLHHRPDPVLIVEGASDVAACVAMNLAGVGRPSNTAGADDLVHLLDGRAVLVVGENDGKPTGAWPGRDGAKSVAVKLAGRWGEPVRWTLPPPGVKDVREYARGRAAGPVATAAVSSTTVASTTVAADVATGAATPLPLADPLAVAGAELLAALTAAAKSAKPEKRSQADGLVDLARELYRLGKADDGEPFAVAHAGPAVAAPFRGGAGGLRAALAKGYRQRTGKTPAAAALADALTALEGLADDAPREPVALRVADHGDGIVLDLADPTGRAAVVTPGGWAVAEASPVLFRRTALTGPLPEPDPGAPASALAELRDLLNVSDDAWPLLAGWLVAAVLPGVPHPVLMLGGEQGTGKSSAARLILGLFDPSPAPLRTEPRDAEQWAVTAAGSWAVCLDNVSAVSHWMSDALCKAVTGDGWVRRRLYTDADLAVLAFRRCIILTSIDAGALRGDLADRLLVADLDRIPDAHRRTEADLSAAYAALRPRLLGGLLSAVAATLAALPGVTLAELPRMADFARVLAALDTACPDLTGGGRALTLFVNQRRRLADDVVAADPVAEAVVGLMDATIADPVTGNHAWAGTAAELLAALTPSHPPPARGWPTTPRKLVGRLNRVRPALATVGITHTPPPPGASHKDRTHRLDRPPAPAPADPRSAGATPPPPPPTPATRPYAAGRSGGDRGGGAPPADTQPPLGQPAQPAAGSPPTDAGGGRGGGGVAPPDTSDPAGGGTAGPVRVAVDGGNGTDPMDAIAEMLDDAASARPPAWKWPG
jgi:hypothetical protein